MNCSMAYKKIQIQSIYLAEGAGMSSLHLTGPSCLNFTAAYLPIKSESITLISHAYNQLIKQRPCFQTLFFPCSIRKKTFSVSDLRTFLLYQKWSKTKQTFHEVKKKGFPNSGFVAYSTEEGGACLVLNVTVWLEAVRQPPFVQHHQG